MSLPPDVDEPPVSSPPRPRRRPLGGLRLTDKARRLLGVPIYVDVPLIRLPIRPDSKDRTDG